MWWTLGITLVEVEHHAHGDMDDRQCCMRYRGGGSSASPSWGVRELLYHTTLVGWDRAIIVAIKVSHLWGVHRRKKWGSALSLE